MTGSRSGIGAAPKRGSGRAGGEELIEALREAAAMAERWRAVAELRAAEALHGGVPAYRVSIAARNGPDSGLMHKRMPNVRTFLSAIATAVESGEPVTVSVRGVDVTIDPTSP